MRKRFGVLIAILIILGAHFKLHSQNSQYEQGEVTYITGIDYQFITQVNKITDFSKNIVRVANDIIDNSIGRHSHGFTFKSGSIFNVKGYFEKYPDMINQIQELIPSYVLYYDWSDTTIGVKSYEIYLCLDKLGQVIYFNFPRNYNFNNINLETFDNAIVKSDSIINGENIKYDKPSIRLDFDECKRDLAWTFNFERLSDSINNSEREIKIFMISKEIEINDIQYKTVGILDTLRIEEIKIEDLIKKGNNSP